MKFLGVSGVFDYAGLSRSSRYRSCSCCLPRITRTSASGLHLFGAEYPPHLSSVYASLCTSRYPAQDSRPSGSLLLSRKELPSSASCRFIPAHCNGILRQLASGGVYSDSRGSIRNNGITRLVSMASRGAACDRTVGLSQKVVAHICSATGIGPAIFGRMPADFTSCPGSRRSSRRNQL